MCQRGQFHDSLACSKVRTSPRHAGRTSASSSVAAPSTLSLRSIPSNSSSFVPVRTSSRHAGRTYASSSVAAPSAMSLGSIPSDSSSFIPALHGGSEGQRTLLWDGSARRAAPVAVVVALAAAPVIAPTPGRPLFLALQHWSDCRSLDLDLPLDLDPSPEECLRPRSSCLCFLSSSSLLLLFL